jgi:hypothetical protein
VSNRLDDDAAEYEAESDAEATFAAWTAALPTTPQARAEYLTWLRQLTGGRVRD